MVAVRQVSAPVTRTEVSRSALVPTQLARFVTPVKPRASHSRLPLQVVTAESPASAHVGDSPASAWQRKQAVFQSSHFEAGKVYASPQKPSALENVRPKVPLKRPKVDHKQMPSPKDMRVTMNADHRVVLHPMESELGSLDRSRFQYLSTVSSQPDMHAAGYSDIVRVRRFNAGRRGRDGWLCTPMWVDSMTTLPSVEHFKAGNKSAEACPSSNGHGGDAIKPMATSKYGARFTRVGSRDACRSIGHGSAKRSGSCGGGYNALTPSPPCRWAESLRNGSSCCVVPDRETLPIVIAAPDDGAIPWEFRALSTNLQWNDSRAELESPRRFGGVRNNKTPRGHADALDCSQDGLASTWVFGGDAEQPKEPRQATRRSQSVQERSSTGRSASSDRVLFPAAPETARFSQVPLTPCEMKCKNLEGSARNPLFKARSARGDIDVAEQLSTPRRKRSPSYTPGAMPESPRRRVERNYSDLFGRESCEMSQRSPRSPRCKFSDLAVCTVLDPRAELDRLARSPGHGRSPSSPRWDRKRNASEVFICQTPRRSKESCGSEEERIWESSRACWDTANSWNTNAEISRRLRERMMEKSNRSPRTPRSPSKDPLPSDAGASARRQKRLDMASGNMRHGIGSTPALWDDGRCGPGPAAASPPTTRMRSFPDSPAFKRSASWTPARSRYFDSVLTSSVF